MDDVKITYENYNPIAPTILGALEEHSLNSDGTIEAASADAIDERLASMGFGERVNRTHDIRTDNSVWVTPAPIRYIAVEIGYEAKP